MEGGEAGGRGGTTENDRQCVRAVHGKTKRNVFGMVGLLAFCPAGRCQNAHTSTRTPSPAAAVTDERTKTLRDSQHTQTPRADQQIFIYGVFVLTAIHSRA